MLLLLLTLLFQSSDFGGLTHYREANAQLPARMTGEQRIVFLGDSITEQWSTTSALPKPAYINRGISGQTSAQMLVRFEQDVVWIGATHVVIMCGINDIGAMQGLTNNEEVAGNIEAMAELAMQHDIVPLLSSVTPTRLTTHPMSRVVAINDLVRAYATAHHLQYIDYFSSMLGNDGLLWDQITTDGIHLNAAGYAIAIPLAEHAIERSLGEG